MTGYVAVTENRKPQLAPLEELGRRLEASGFRSAPVEDVAFAALEGIWLLSCRAEQFRSRVGSVGWRVIESHCFVQSHIGLYKFRRHPRSNGVYPLKRKACPCWLFVGLTHIRFFIRT